MIKIANHLGTVTVTPKYLVKLISDQTSACFGVSALNGVDISRRGEALDIKLYIAFAEDVNIPAVADAVSHKIAYVLTRKTGVKVRAVDIYADACGKRSII